LYFHITSGYVQIKVRNLFCDRAREIGPGEAAEAQSVGFRFSAGGGSRFGSQGSEALYPRVNNSNAGVDSILG